MIGPVAICKQKPGEKFFFLGRIELWFSILYADYTNCHENGDKWE
jgi:hypothetical protein